jgi:concentrative nucleoside transporter, CNT family
MPPRIMSFIGIICIVFVAYLLSRDRGNIRWRQLCWGIGLQYLVAIVILKTYPDAVFAAARTFFDGVSSSAGHGARFLFGSLVDKNDFVILSMGSVIIFITAVLAILNHTRVLPAFIFAIARVMQKTLKTSGAETTAAFMFILLGIETIAGLKKIIGRMTQSELFSVMTCFMANIAGSVMAVYVGVFGANPGYILAATLMNAPAGLALSKMILPETAEPETGGKVEWRMLKPDTTGLISAAAGGALDGLRLAATIGAILLAFVSIIYVLDSFLGLFGASFGLLGGYVFAPVAYVLGVPWEDCQKAGTLLATKVVFNEWLAYGQMQQLITAGELSQRAITVMTFGLCSFANFGSLAILIGSVSALAPERREEVNSLGYLALITGLLSGFLTTAVAGTLYPG